MNRAVERLLRNAESPEELEEIKECLKQLGIKGKNYDSYCSLIDDLKQDMLR